MGWIDDRIWCHPKFTDITDRAFRAYVNGIAYSSGFGTRGVLTPGQQKKIGSDAKIRAELLEARLWDVHGQGVMVHDWDEHNGKRDARRAADRERKRRDRSTGASAGLSAGQDGGASTLSARVDGSEGSDGSDIKPKAVSGNGSAGETNSLRLAVK